MVQEIEYDEQGNIMKNTNPDFQPLGYAGGLFDADTKLVLSIIKLRNITKEKIARNYQFEDTMKKIKVFILQHVHVVGEREDVKLIGVYTTQKNANDAKNRSKKLPGFRKNLKGFSIDEYLVDEDYWTEGFITK